MASENRPGVIITQALSETVTATATPSLVPVVMAPCYQIVNALSDNGSLNASAKHTDAYQQASLSITQANFPDPRSNINELDIEESSVRVFTSSGGTLTELALGSNGSAGTSFLQRFKDIYQPAIQFSKTSLAQLAGTDTKTLVVAIDAGNVLDTTGDITVTFDVNTGTTLAAAAAAINLASQAVIGADIAFVDNSLMHIASPSYGPGASVTIRAGSSAIVDEYLHAGLTSGTDSYRVEGAGLAAEQTGSDLTSTYIEYRSAVAYIAGVPQGGLPGWAGSITSSTVGSMFSSSAGSAVTFAGANATIPLKAATTTTPGDYLVIDGQRPELNEVILVESGRFKLGKLNTALSVSDNAGGYATRVYDTLSFGTTLSETNALSPQNAYFVAQNLEWGQVSPAGTAASITSSTDNRIAARKAMVSGLFSVTDGANNPAHFASNNPVAMTGLTLVIEETLNDVKQAAVTHTFEGTLTMAQVAASIIANTSLSCTADEVDGYLVISSGSTGASESLSVKSNGTANALLGFSTSASTDATGKDIEVATQAVITGTALTVMNSLDQADYVLTINIEDSFGDRTVVSSAIDFSTPPNNVTAIRNAVAVAFGGTSGNLLLHENGIPFASVDIGGSGSNQLVITSIEGGADVSLTFVSTASSSGGADFGIANGAAGTGMFDKLKDSTLTFALDGSPGNYEVNFDSNSIEDAKDAINLAVGSSFDVASVNSSGALTLTSGFKGIASEVSISTGGAQATDILDFTTTSASGGGRPNPDFYINSANAVVIGANIIRNSATGIPFASADTNIDIYVQYKALRLDVTASASDAGLLSFGDLSTMEASIGPFTQDNPLGLAAYLCMINSPSLNISCLGIDEVSSASPMGTVDGYMRALEFLESKEVYALAPMTDDHFIQSLISTHVQLMSVPAERGERIALLWKTTPDRAVDTSISGGSGTGTQSGIDNELNTESPIANSVIEAGISDVTSIAVDKELYVEVTTVALGSTSVKNYSISKISGSTLTLRVSFSSSENSDGFFSTDTFSGSATFGSITYAVRIRGKELLVTGTSLPDVSAITAAAAAQASDFNHRRVFLAFGDTVDVPLSGVSTNIPGYYISAGLAGMVASREPQQPFTNLPMTGYTKVYGTDDTYSENQMDVIADGGRYILKNQGSAIAARHQRSTANSTLEARELSITKSIDFLAKGLRTINRDFIGRFVVTPGFLDQLTMANEGFLRRVSNSVVRTAKLKSLLQSEASPDTILIEVEVQPAYPCNKIRITIVS